MFSFFSAFTTYRFTVKGTGTEVGSKASLAQYDNGGIENGMFRVPH